MRTRWLPVMVLVASAALDAPARADDFDEPGLHRQIQADLGLSVVGLAYEHPIGSHLAIQVEAQVFSTYYAPWFDVGDKVSGIGGQLRPTYFPRRGGHGLYIAPYLRVDRVTGERDGASGHAFGYAVGGFVGWAFPLSVLDLRIGAGAQYMSYTVDTAMGVVECKTPFVALDVVVGYRL